MKRYIKLSLLLLLLPLFIKNVYAEEIIEKEINSPLVEITEETISMNDIENTFDDKNQDINEEELSKDNMTGTEDNISEENNQELKSEEENNNEKLEEKEEVSLELVLEVIDESYELDLNETDALEDEENNSKIKEELETIIEEKLKENNYDLLSMGYSYKINWNYFNNNNKNSYTLEIYDINNNLIDSTELEVKYNNSNIWNEEDNNKVEEFIKKIQTNIQKKYTLDEFIQNRKENKDLYYNLQEELDKLFKDSDINYYLLPIAKTSNLLSNSITEKIVLSINNVIYKTISIENGYITEIDVPGEENEKEYIETYFKDKLKEYNYSGIFKNIKYVPDEQTIFITTEQEEISLGKININKINKEYNILEGNNSTITTEDNLQIKTDGNLNELKRIEINSVELNQKYYNTSNNILLIKNEFIKALTPGKYNLELIFKTGRSKTIINVIKKNPVIINKPNTEQQRPIISRPIYNNNYNNYNTYNTYENIEDQSKLDELNEQIEEEKEEQEETDLKETDINLDNILEVDKGNEDNADSKEEQQKEDNSFMERLKSRYVPIIIVVIAVLVGGITAYVYLKAREEKIL